MDELKKEIETLNEQLIPNFPYEVAKTQLRLRAFIRGSYSMLAAEKLGTLLGVTLQGSPIDTFDWNQYGVFGDSESGFGPYHLYKELCQYDDWRAWHEKLKQHCEIADWIGITYESFPVAVWDASNDPDFEKSPQKTFEIRTKFYDSHFAGY